MKDDANSRKMDIISPNRSKRSSVSTPRRSAAAVGGGGTSALVQSFREALDDLVVEHDKPTPRSGPLTSQRQQRKKEDILGCQITKILNQQPEFRQPLHLGFDKDSLESLSCYPTLQPLISSRNWRWLRRKLQEGVSLLLSQKESPGDVRIVFSFVFWNIKSLSSGISTFCALLFLYLAAGATIATFATVWTIQCSWIVLATALALLVDLNEIRHLIPTPMHRIFIDLVNGVKNFDRTVLLGRRYQGREWGKSDFEYEDGKSAPSFGQYLWDMPPPLSSEEAKAERRNDRLGWSEDTKTHIQAIDFCQAMLREAFVRKQYGKLRKAVFKRKKTNSMEMARKKGNEDLSEDYDLARSSSDPASVNIDEVEAFKIETLMEETDLPGGHFDGVNLSTLDGILADDDNSFSSNSTTHHQDRSQNSTDSDTDLNWMDVGAEIGKKLLSSAAVQKAMTSHDTAERIVTIKENFEEKMAAQANVDTGAESELWARGETGSRGKTPAAALPPVHSMWTSASAAAQVAASPDNTVDSNRSMDPISRNRQIFESIRIDDTKPSQKPFVLSPRRMYSKNEVWGESEESLPELGPKSPKQLIISPLHLGKSACDSPIEVVRESLCHSQTPKELRKVNRRAQLLSGVKIAVPIFPYQPGSKSCRVFHRGNFQMATVISSKRLAIFQKNSLPPPGKRQTNCLAITVQLDKSFLREGKFAAMTLRIMDDWPDRYMPKHSKFPIGSCVATSFGVGVLVGWRIEDDCHVVRSLWQRRGPGSASAYLRRDAIHSTTGAATGFEVVTKLGIGEIKGYTHAGSDFRMGRYLVEITGPGKHHDQTLALNKGDIVSCKSARFIPVIEHIREAVQYQLQVDRYNDSMEPHDDDLFESMKGKHWQKISTYSDILWKSFLRATEEDDEFDEGMNDFIASIVSFFENLDAQPGSIDSNGKDVSNIVITATDSSKSQQREETTEPGFLNDFFGFFGGNGLRKNQDPDESIEIEVTDKLNEAAAMAETEKNYNKAFAVIRTLMRTVSIARAGCTDEPEFKLGLSLCYEFLLFIKTVVRVQQKNMNPHSLQIWKRALDEIVSTFGPIKERLERIGKGIAERMEKHGRRAKVRLLRFVDIIVQDDTLLMSMEQGDWPRCFEQIELALVVSKIIDEQSREHYHRTAQYVVKHFVDIATKNSTAAARNNEKLEKFAAVIKCIAAPRKFLLRLLVQDWVLDALERVLVRVFDDEDVAFQMLSIHASNFHSLRQFRMLKDFTIAGKFWMPLLDAADAEFSFLSSQMPDGAKDYIVPLSSLFSLCVLQFHKIDDGDLTKDWLDFLLEEEAVNIIHDIDVKLILALESFSRDVKEMMVVLPYYPSIEDDILNLVDEVDIDEFLKEASNAVDDPEKLSEFIREKATIAIERFLDYLPKMSIPVEKRDLADGWVLTCRGADGGDLKLTDLTIKRENLTCQVMGGDTLFFPMLGSEGDDGASDSSAGHSLEEIRRPEDHESSVLDHIRILLMNARQHGCWQEGTGGIHDPPKDRYVASVLRGLPVSSVLNCGIELWRNLEIDDDELLEIAVRDVSYQIQLQVERETSDLEKETKDDLPSKLYRQPLLARNPEMSDRNIQHRFNPRVDPTVLYLEIQNLTFNLEKFLFRIEKHEEKRTVFDPIFEGSGSLMVRNVSIKLRVECVKDYVKQMGRKRPVPLLQINELEVQLEKVKLTVKNTGADWLLNKVVKSFEDNITHILATNLNEQVGAQLELALENLNGYFAVNPDLVLGLLDISLDDLSEKVAFV